MKSFWFVYFKLNDEDISVHSCFTVLCYSKALNVLSSAEFHSPVQTAKPEKKT